MGFVFLGIHIEETVFLSFLNYFRKLLNPRRELQLVQQKYRWSLGLVLESEIGTIL